MDQVQITANLQGPPRTETVMGTEYTVVSATLVQSQVLNNNLGATFLPAEEINSSWAEMANGAPVLVDHPTRSGAPISARDPHVLNSQGVGHLYRVRAEGAALKGDVFLNRSRAEAVEGLGAVLERLDKGLPVEQSTGFPLLAEQVSGEHDGQPYDLVMRPTGFDHLAVFADKVGACSVSDGCGLGINHEGDCDTASGGQPSLLAALRGLGTEVVSRLRGLLGSNQSDEDVRETLARAIEDQFGGGGDVWTWVDSVFSEDGQVVFSVEAPDGVTLLRAAYEMTDEGVQLGEPEQVVRRTTFEPVPGANNGGSDMDRAALIEALGDKLPAAAAEHLSDCQLKALHEAQQQDSGGGDGNDDALNALTETVSALREQIAELKAGTSDYMAEQAAEKMALVTRLAGNERVPFDEAELQSKPIAELRKLERMARPGHYAGAGGPMVVAPEQAEHVSIPTPYHETEAHKAMMARSLGGVN